MNHEQRNRLRNTFEQAVMAGERALDTFGPSAQENMAMEEMGELITELARYSRGRSTCPSIVGECADVIITVMQVAMMNDSAGGVDALIDAVATKTARLNQRIADAGAK